MAAGRPSAQAPRPVAVTGDWHSWARPGHLAVALLARAAGAVPVPVPDAGGAVVIADYGCSEGHNSLRPVGVAVDEFRRRGGDGLEVRVLHTDLPDNDFASLFATLRDDPLTYVRPGVFPSAVGRSYFEPIVPAGTVTLGWCSIALHWLSARPGPLTGTWPLVAPRAERDVWRAAGAADWSWFLEQRSRELSPGGRLVVVSGAAAEDGRSGGERVMQAIDELLREPEVRGPVAPEVVDDLALPVWYRTEAEWRAPFSTPPVGDALRLEECRMVRLGDPLWEQTRGEPEAYARAAADAVRVSYGPSLVAGVPTEHRAGLTARLFDEALPRRIAAAAEEPWFDWRLAVLSIVRTTDQSSVSHARDAAWRSRSARGCG